MVQNIHTLFGDLSSPFFPSTDIMRLMDNLSKLSVVLLFPSNPDLKLHLEDIISLRALFGAQLNTDERVGSEALWVRR